MYQEQEIEKLAREKSAIKRESEKNRKELEKLREDVRQKDNGESAMSHLYIPSYLQ